MVAPAFAPSTASGDASETPVSGDPRPAFQPPEGEYLVRRSKEGATTGLPNVHYGTEFLEAGNFAGLTERRDEARGVSREFAEKCVAWYDGRPNSGTVTIEQR